MGIRSEKVGEAKVEDHRSEKSGSVDAADETLARVLASRERHRQRSIFVRAGVVVAGAGIGIFAALLSVITPEFGLPLMLVGLRLLALEFDWAARLYTRVARLAKRAAGMFRRLWSRSKVGVVLSVVALVVVVAAVFALLG